MAIARALAKEDVHVVVSDVQVEAGMATVAKLGGSATFVHCDVSQPDQVRALIGATVERFGKLDIMVNNAGLNASSREERTTVYSYPDATLHRIINVDLNGTFY